MKIRRPPKGRVPRGERVFVWIVLWPFVLILGGGQLYLCIQFLMAGGVLGS